MKTEFDRLQTDFAWSHHICFVKNSLFCAKEQTFFVLSNTVCYQGSRVAMGGQGGQSTPLTAKKLPKIGKKREKIRKKEEKSGRKGKNREGSLTLPLLTDRAGYATVSGMWFLELSDMSLGLKHGACKRRSMEPVKEGSMVKGLHG